MKPASSQGFTLIELLVVIAVIGLLASVVLVSLNTARSKARDAKRRADLNQLAKALELYYNDNNASYPSTGAGNWWGNCSTFGSHGTTGANGWIPNLAPTYVSSLPLDPKPIGASGCYLYRSDNGADYKILSYTTVENPIPAGDPMTDPGGRGTSYAVYTSGAAAY